MRIGRQKNRKYQLGTEWKPMPIKCFKLSNEDNVLLYIDWNRKITYGMYVMESMLVGNEMYL